MPLHVIIFSNRNTHYKLARASPFHRAKQAKKKLAQKQRHNTTIAKAIVANFILESITVIFRRYFSQTIFEIY